MSTPNLNLDHITEGQTNKETTANAAFDGLDNAMNTVLEIAITGDTVLTDAQLRGNYLFRLTGSPGSSFVLTIPNGYARGFCISNEADADAFIEMEDAASDAITVNSSATGILHTDGTSLFDLGGGTGGGSAGSSSITLDPKTADFEVTNTHLSGDYILPVDSASDVTVSLVGGLTGTEPVVFIQEGDGQLLFDPDSAVTILAADGGVKTRTQGSTASLIPVGTDTYILAGDVVSVDGLVISVSASTSYLGNAGAGHSLRIDKAATGDEARVAFEVGSSARARVGLLGDDDLTLEVSADGSAWNDAFVVDKDTGVVAFPQGLTLGAGTDILNLFEYGSWTPVPADAATGGNTGTASTAAGAYARIGKLIWASFALDNISTTGMTGANTLYVQGLPYTLSSSIQKRPTFQPQVQNFAFTEAVTAAPLTGGTSIVFADMRGGTSLVLTKVSDLTSGSAKIFGNFVYLID